MAGEQVLPAKAASSPGPLLFLDRRMAIIEAAGGEPGALRGRFCWDVFRCGIARPEHCRAVNVETSRDAAGAATPARGDARPPCMLLPMPRTTGGTVLWRLGEPALEGLPNSVNLHAGVSLALAGATGLRALTRAVRFLAYALGAARATLSIIGADGAIRRINAAWGSEPDAAGGRLRRVLRVPGARKAELELRWRETGPERECAPRLRFALHPLALAVASLGVADPVPVRGEVSDAERPHLVLRCLGPFEASASGRILSARAFPRRAARSLLMLLALHAGRALDRERIAESLWPDAPPEATVNRLHGVVHALRAAIDPNQGDTVVRSDGSRYILSPGASVEIDLTQFRERLARAKAIARAGGPDAERIQILESALSLYRGELFEDEIASDWWIAERATLSEQALEGYAALVSLYARSGQHERALHGLRRALRIDPFREDMQSGLIVALLALGRRAEAIRECHAFKRMMREELGVEIDADLDALCRSTGARKPG